MSAMMKSQIPQGNNINDEEFFSLLDDFERNVLGPAAQKMASEVETTGMSRADLATATNSVQGIQQVITKASSYRFSLSRFVSSQQSFSRLSIVQTLRDLTSAFDLTKTLISITIAQS